MQQAPPRLGSDGFLLAGVLEPMKPRMVGQGSPGRLELDQMSLLESPIRWTRLAPGSRRLTESPKGPRRDAITSGKVPILLPREAESFLRAADAKPIPPAPVDNCARGPFGEAAA